MKRTIGAACAFSLLLAAPAMSDTIDFEDLVEGQIVSSVSGSGGLGPVGVDGINPDLVGNSAMIYDSDCEDGGGIKCTGQDEDLGSPNETFGGPGVGEGGEMGQPKQNDRTLSNILIVSEDQNGDDPDDADLMGAELALDFTAIGPVTVTSMDMIDVEGEEDGGTVELLAADMSLVALFNIPTTGNNGLENVQLGPTSGVSYMRVILNGSGGIDNIVIDTEERCGNDMQEDGEECDGSDADACPDQCQSDCTCPEAPGGEGCTPGYWKQRHHYDSWMGCGQSDNFNEAFGTSWSFNEKKCGTTDPTLLQALRCRGGAAQALARHAAAALLNTKQDGVDYALGTSEVKALVKAALDSGDLELIQDTKNQLAGENEQGCPLN